MKGLQSAINNSVAGQNLLTVAEKAMGSIASLLTGDPTDTQDTGIIGLLNSGSDFDKILSGMNQLANTIDSISRTTVYNGKQVINGAYDYNALPTKISGPGTGKISNVNVTSADVFGSKPVEFNLTVDKVAQRAGVKLATAVPSGSNENDIYEIMLTDGEGNSVSFEITAGTGGTIAVADLKTEINKVLENSNTNIELILDNGDQILRSKTKGANQSITIDATKGGTSVNFSTVFTNAGDGYINTTTTTNQTKAVGQDWSLSGVGGTVVTNNNNINVYSDSISFSALLDGDIKANDVFNLKVSGGTSFQLGKDVSSAGRYNVGIATINSNNLVAKDGSTLASLRTLKEGENENEYIVRAQEAIADFATQIATERGRLGTIQKNVLVTNQYNLEDQLAIVTAEEAAISNTDVALETSRLSRQELIAESAMNVISYARSFSQFAVSSLFQ
jgi:flagellin